MRRTGVCANYGLAGFFGAAVLGAGALAFPFSAPPLLRSVKASLALKGKRRTDCSPVVLRVTSTRRLLARRTVSRFFRIFCFSAGFKSGSASISCLRSEEHTSELQSRLHLVCRLLLEKKKKTS